MKSSTLKFIRSFLCSLLLIIGVLGSQAVLIPPQDVLAVTDFRNILENIGDKSKLPNYNTNVHADASLRPGAKNITSAIFFVIDFIKYTLGSVAVLMVIVQAIQLITAGKEAEEKITKLKEYLKYALTGLVLIFVSEEAVKLAFFGEEGEFLQSEASAAEFATAGGGIIEGIYTMGEVFIGSIAVLMIVYSGMEMLTGALSEEQVSSAKKRVYMAGVGIFIIGISELVVRDIIFKNQGQEIDVARGRSLLVSITNFLASVIGTLSVGAFVYAGFLYILNFGEEESTGKAKKIMWGALLGIVLAGAAFAIVSTVIPVEGAK